MCKNISKLGKHNSGKETEMTEYAFDNSKLRGRIVEKYGTIDNFSKAINKNRSSISLILNDKATIDRRDMMLFCSALGIENKDVGDYFFTTKVVNS